MSKHLVFICQPVMQANRVVALATKLAAAASWSCLLMATASGCGGGTIAATDDSYSEKGRDRPDAADAGTDEADGDEKPDQEKPDQDQSDDRPATTVKRLMDINDWGTFDNEKSMQAAIDRAIYMNADAVGINVYSQSIEAEMVPEHASWDSHHTWGFFQKAVDYSHSKGIKCFVWMRINGNDGAEKRLWNNSKVIVLEDGSTDGNYRNDLAFEEVFEYEMGLVHYMLSRYRFDGILFEEPAYWVGTYSKWESYSQGMRDHVLKKHGIDIFSPQYRGASEATALIRQESEFLLLDFFRQTKEFAASLPNKPVVTAAGPSYSFRGLNPVSALSEGNLDAFFGGNYLVDMTEFNTRLDKLRQSTNGLLGMYIAVTWSSLDGGTNENFISQVDTLCKKGIAVQVLWSEFYFRSRTIGGVKVMELLHNTPVGSCAGLPIP